MAQALCQSTTLQLFGFGNTSFGAKEAAHEAANRAFTTTVTELYPQHGPLRTVLIHDDTAGSAWRVYQLSTRLPKPNTVLLDDGCDAACLTGQRWASIPHNTRHWLRHTALDYRLTE